MIKKDLLKRQIRWINDNKANVFGKASKTYYTVTNKNNNFLNKICCYFKELEKACDKYNPNYTFKKKQNK